MSFKIENPGFYRRRDGGKAEVFAIREATAFVADGNGWYTAIQETGTCFDGGKHRDLIAPWTEPVVGTLEWVRTLPKETKVWHKSYDPNQSVEAGAPYIGNPDGWFIVGTAEWANALPVGTKVRWKTWSSHEYVTKTEHGWRPLRFSLCVPGELPQDIHGTGWELYTATTPRPWSKPEDVPLGAFVRQKDDVKRLMGWFIINQVDAGGVPVVSGKANQWLTFKELYECYEHSTDGGMTWGPCVVKEAV